MVRRLALIVLLAGVAFANTASAESRQPVSSERTKSKSKSKSAKKTKKSKKAKKSKRVSSRVKKKRAKKRRVKKIPRIPDRTTNYKANMPRGFRWPPTRAMKKASERCEEELAELGIEWAPAKPEGRIAAPIVVPAMELGGIAYKSAFRRPPHTMDCRFARTLVTIGPTLQALGVREIKFGSIFRNTTVRANGKSKNILSRHALGIAMDIVSFTDVNGRVVTVKDDYPLQEPLLIAVEDVLNDSGLFRTVLTPRNDPTSHHDHFHLEALVEYSARR